MPSLINHPQAENFTYRFRSYCLNDSKRGKWRENEQDAKDDADAHKAKPDNSGHKVVIEIEQKYVVAW